MNIQKIPSIKIWLLDLWIDLERCLENTSYRDEENYDDFEQAVIILEDRRYLQHRGIDYRSIARVLILQLAGTGRGGASTIEMQFVRTVTGRYERTVRRKFREAILARLLAFHRNKAAILRGYLQIAYFGYRLRGAEQAAERIFGKTVGELTAGEAAILASMLVYPAPNILPNLKWSAKITRRSEYGKSLLTAAKQRRK